MDCNMSAPAFIARALRGLRADSAIWLLVAALLFAGSAILTSVITHVERHSPQVGLVLSFSGPEQSRKPTAAFYAEDRDLLLVIDNIENRLKDIRFGPLPDQKVAEVRCSEDDLATSLAYGSPIVHGRLEPAPRRDIHRVRVAYKAPQFYDIDIAKLNREYPYKLHLSKYKDNVPKTLRRVECRLPSIVVHDTFTSRTLEAIVHRGLIFNESTGNVEVDSYVLPESVSLTDEDARDIQVTNLNTGETRLGSTMFVPAGPGSANDVELSGKTDTTLTFTWDSIPAGEHRDIYIVMIGSLIALGAAAAIEAVRPYIKNLVRTNEAGD